MVSRYREAAVMVMHMEVKLMDTSNQAMVNNNQDIKVILMVEAIKIAHMITDLEEVITLMELEEEDTVMDMAKKDSLLKFHYGPRSE